MAAQTLSDIFAREVRCQAAQHIEVPADTVWAVIGDIGSTVPTAGAVERVDVEGQGAGALRTYHFPGGGAVVERIEEYDPAARRYVYRIIDYGPLPMVRYLGLAEVVPAGPGACILCWTAMADPVDGDAETLEAVLRAGVTGAVTAVSHYVLDQPVQ